MGNDYVKICPSSEVFNKRGKLFKLDDETEIALFRVDGVVYAVDNVCPHNHAPLMFDGYIEEMYVACPIHGFKFHLKTGEQPTKIGCRLRTFDVKEENEEIWVKKPEKKLFDFEW